jgi:hypothetical protein
MVLGTYATTSKEYWDKIQKRADEKYKGMDMNFTLNLSYSESDDEDSKGGKVGITVPLYNTSAKRSKLDEKRSFLKEGAGYCRQLEESTNNIEVVEEQIKLSKAMMYEEGASGVEAFLKLQKTLNEEKANKNEAIRNIEMMLKY